MRRNITYVCMQTLEQGQAAHAHVFEIIKGLKKRGWKVDLIQSSPGHNTSTSSSKTISKLAVVKKIIDSIMQQAVYFPKNSPDIYYVRFHFLTIVILMRAKIMKIPIIFEINGPFEDVFIAWPLAKKFRKFLIYIMEYQLKQSTYIIAVTPQLAIWASSIAHHQRVSVIPNGANTDIFRRTIETNYSDKYAVFFGTLASWQGIDTIIAATRLPAWPDDTKMVIIGDGELSSKVSDAAKDSNRLVYLNRQKYETLPDLISGAILSISVQNNTGDRAKTGLSPLKVYESLACATPIIVSDFPGMADFVRELDCGIVIEPDNANALAEAVKIMAENPELTNQMGARGLHGVLASHSWDARASRTEEVIVDVLKNSSKILAGSI